MEYIFNFHQQNDYVLSNNLKMDRNETFDNVLNNVLNIIGLNIWIIIYPFSLAKSQQIYDSFREE